MTKNNKIMLGLGLVAVVGAYFYFENKKKKNTEAKSDFRGARRKGIFNVNRGSGKVDLCYCASCVNTDGSVGRHYPCNMADMKTPPKG
jgi:hypothetical protein